MCLTDSSSGTGDAEIIFQNAEFLPLPSIHSVSYPLSQTVTERPALPCTELMAGRVDT